MSRSEREAREAQAIADEAAEYLRIRKALAPKPMSVHVRTVYPWPVNFNFPMHAYRETYFAGLLPQTEVLLRRTGAAQEQINNHEWTRAAIQSALRPAERPQLGVVI
jgi:hypothetical protein